MSVEKPREIAVRILMRRVNQREYVETMVEEALETSGLLGPDRGLLQELVCGVVRWESTLDWLIERQAPGRTQKPALQVLLRLGLYQLFWLDRIPDHAAVNEAVTLAKDLGYGPQAGFVNAVLRTCLRERQTLRQALDELKVTQPAVGYSHPGWLCDRWRAAWGEDDCRKLLDWNNTPPRNWARVNALRAKIEGLREMWVSEGVQVTLRVFNWAKDLLIYEMSSARPIGTLSSFKRGFFYVQDPSTLLAATLLHPQPGESILDFCAAPGGKTTLIAQLMENRGRITAHDTAPDRLKTVQENCQRLGVTCVETADPSALEKRPKTQLFDRVLVDAPCSNTGVLRRRVDLRWRIRPEEITRLRNNQLEILGKAAAWVKPGGFLVYSTCSLERVENEEVIKDFLKRQPEFRVQQERTLTPFADGVDGAFAARLARASS